MKLSCTDVLVPGNSYTEKAQILRKLGFEGMAVYAAYETWTEQDEAELLQLRERTGIPVVEFAFVGPKFGHLMDVDPKKSAETFQMYCDSVRVAGKLGALTELECDIRRTEPLPFEHFAYPVLPQKSMVRFVSFVQALCDLGRESNTRVLIEAVNRYEALYVNRQMQALALTKQVDRPNTGLLCDLFHMGLDEENICEVLRSCAASVQHVHLADSNRLLPGKGTLPWREIMDTLNEIKFTGYMNLECAVQGNAVQELQEVSQFLKRMIQ